MDGDYVSYCRVSTARQGRSGLGLEGQQAAIRDYLNGGTWRLLAQYVEVESGKRDDNRPELIKAMDHCRLTNAKLLIAKIDRLSRDASFLLSLQKAGVDFVAVDMPNANRLTVGLMAVIAEAEREMISARTKAALAAAKARGRKLGGLRPNTVPVDHAAGRAAKAAKHAAYVAQVRPVAEALRAEGMSLKAIADEMNAKGIRRPQGGSWAPAVVCKLLGPARRGEGA